MRRYTGVIVLAVAVGFGVLAFVLVNRWMADRTSVSETVKRVTNPTIKIVIASEPVDIGASLTDKNTFLADWPKSYTPEGSFSDINEVKGRIAAVKMVTGEPVLQNKLAVPGSSPGLVATIRPDMRAISIKVDEASGVAGFILPNTYVDVIAVELKPNKRDTVETILKKIRVLAIAQEPVTEDGKPKVVHTVTLEVTPKQCEELALQTNKARIHLVLRNPGEPKKIEIAAKPEKPKPVSKKYIPVLKSRIRSPKMNPFAVEVIRGIDREKLRFKNFKSEEKA